MRARVLLAASLAIAAPLAGACGYCVEDKMAMVYDHDVVMRAARLQHRVAFFAVVGNVPSAQTLVRMAHSVRGVDAGTARASTDAGAISFAFDPGRATLGDIARVLERRLAARGCSPQLVTVLDKVAPLRPGATAAAR